MSTLTEHFFNGKLVYFIKTYTQRKESIGEGGSKGACSPWKLI